MGEERLDAPEDGHDPASALAARWSRHLSFDRRRSVHTVRAYVATAHRFAAEGARVADAKTTGRAEQLAPLLLDSAYHGLR